MSGYLALKVMENQESSSNVPVYTGTSTSNSGSTITSSPAVKESTLNAISTSVFQGSLMAEVGPSCKRRRTSSLSNEMRFEGVSCLAVLMMSLGGASRLAAAHHQELSLFQNGVGDWLNEAMVPMLRLCEELHSQVKSLQNSFVEEKSKVNELEVRMQEIEDNFFTLEDEAELDNSCKDLDIRKNQTKSFLYYLHRINFNIFLNKPSNESSVWPDPNRVFNAERAINEDYSNYQHTLRNNNPWIFVDLKEPHLIWEIEIMFRETKRTSELKIYVANEITFDNDGKPDMYLLPVFASQAKRAHQITVTFTHPGGMCGRYVLITREIQSEFLIVLKIKGIGYPLRQN